jgi:amino acid adenylation domain-containing protein
MLLHDHLQASAERDGDAIAIVDVDACARISYHELDGLVGQLALALQQRGVTRGDRVALFLPNGLDMVVGIYAALRCGAAFMPISPQTKPNKLRYVLEDAEPRCLITHVDLLPAARAALGEMHAAGTDAGLAAVLVAGEDAAAVSAIQAFGDGRLAPLAQAFAAEGTLRAPEVIDLDLAAIIYTSGSTGEPKGVMLSHRNMVAAADSIATYLELRGSDVILCALPLSFDYGLYQVLMAVKVGAAVHVVPSFAFPVEILAYMQREHVTVFPGVPTMFALLLGLDVLWSYELPALRLLTNTAAALSIRQIEQLRRAFPAARLFSMYGLTECKRVSYLPPEQLDVRPSSIGKGMPNEEVYLVDVAGHKLPPGSVGELVVRGSNVMMGYWRKPEETAQRLRPGPYPGERVLFTGDLFRSDAQGYLYFVGRTDDIIKSRGEKVSPREVENVLHDLDGVREVAVVGVPDAVLGEAVKAYIVLSPGVSYTAPEVVRFCHARLESFMVPKQIEFVPTLPRTNTGKVSKSELKRAESAR